MAVHWMEAGQAICGAGTPHEWPDGDIWVGPGGNGNHNQITCPKCRSEFNSRYSSEGQELLIGDDDTVRIGLPEPKPYCIYATKETILRYMQLQLDPALGVVMSLHLNSCAACRAIFQTIREEERSL